MSTTEKITYLNTATCGLVTPEVRQAGVSLYEAFEKNSSARSELWRFTEQDRIRETIADFIGAPANNIAMIPNFSWAMNGIVHSIKGKKKRVLLYKQDFPSLLEPFKINDFAITWVESNDGFNLPVEEIKNHIQTNAIDIVAISHVQWGSGYKLDIAEIGRLGKEHQVLFIVDATQSLGAVPIRMKELDVDVFIASNYKWMNGGFGTGILYVKDSFLEAYPLLIIGLNSFSLENGKWSYQSSVRGFEPGHPNMFGFSILEAAIKQKQAIGLEAIEKHNLELTHLLLEELQALPAQLIGGQSIENRGSTLVMRDEAGLGDWFKKHQIIVTHRNGTLRISLHFYNTKEDVVILVDCLKRFYKKGSE